VTDDAQPKQELLIIRRGGGDDNAAHKGGAWKIAYADFVTAMMAFFLVMWLINSANEVTKARVASYFNPIKMTDASPAKRGLKQTTEPQNPKNNLDSDESAQGETAEKSTGEAVAAALKVSEDEMLKDPYAYLDDLVKHSSFNSGKVPKVGDSQVIGDPFDPQSYEMLSQVDDQHQESAEQGTAGEQKLKEGSKTAKLSTEDDSKPADVEAASQKSAAQSLQSGEVPVGEMRPGLDELGEEKSGEQAAGLKKSGNAATGEKFAGLQSAGDAMSGQQPDGESKPGKGGAQEHAPSPQDLKLAADIGKEIEKKVGELSLDIGIRTSVRATEEGILVVLEDGSGRSMFSIGSAQPNPALVEIIGKIGGILSQQKGGVIIRGHTDARRFRVRSYDNWQLSTERAHMASYMLIRGGLQEERISRIEGFGSSEPINKADPLADENRRVEFLLTR